MPKNTKICRVCGAEYEACHSVRTGTGVFNWREVACSPECGMRYFKLVEAARLPTDSAIMEHEVTQKSTMAKRSKKAIATPVSDVNVLQDSGNFSAQNESLEFLNDDEPM